MIGEATGQDPIPSIPSRDFAIIPDDFCGLSPKLLKKKVTMSRPERQFSTTKTILKFLSSRQSAA